MPTRQPRDQHAPYRTGPSVAEQRDTRVLWDMAGPVQRGSRERGRSLRRASSAPSAGAASSAGRGSAATIPKRSASSTQARDETTQLLTRSTYRHLVCRGLAPDEAATLTAFMCGIPIAEVHWSLRQVNELLFLRALVRAGRFGSSDGGRARPH